MVATHAAAPQGRWFEEGEMPPQVVRSMPRVGTYDHEDDLVAVNDVYENRFRFYWLTAAWIILAFQSLIMTMVVLGLALGSVDTRFYSVVIHLMCTLVSIGGIGGLAFIYRWVLFPNSRWVPAIVAAPRVQNSVQDRPGQPA